MLVKWVCGVKTSYPWVNRGLEKILVEINSICVQNVYFFRILITEKCSLYNGTYGLKGDPRNYIILSQHSQAITCPEKCGMKSLILSQTSTLVSLQLRMGESFHPTLHYVCEFTYQCWGTNIATWQPWCHMCHLGTVNKHTYRKV